MTFEEWQAAGLELRNDITDIRFQIGDWANKGFDAFGIKEVHSIAESLGWSKSTLRAYSWVASCYPPEKRLHPLSFFHYQTAAAVAEPLRSELLERAVRENLSAREIGGMLGKYPGTIDGLRHGEAEVIVKCTEAEVHDLARIIRGVAPDRRVVIHMRKPGKALVV